MWNKLLWLLVVVILFAGCKTRQKVAKVEKSDSSVISAGAESIRSFEMNNLDFHTFSGRAKTKIQMNKRERDVTLNIRIDRDKAIWISVTAILGVEVARVLITPDSVKIINRLQGEYLKKPFSYVYNYVNPGVTFTTLQDLLLANVSSQLLRASNVQVASAQDEFIVVGIKDQLSFQYRINTDNRPFNFILEEVEGMSNLEAYYANYISTEGYNFPQNMALDIAGENMSIGAKLNFDRVRFNAPVEMPFTVSERYKVIN
ncbi:MAG: DUF4292 domain-containing protein [Sphingobacterium sp.]